jgi:hypothetical protein
MGIISVDQGRLPPGTATSNRKEAGKPKLLTYWCVDQLSVVGRHLSDARHRVRGILRVF